MLPWIELRGSIPFGIGIGLNPVTVFLTAVVLNTLIFFPIFFALQFFYKYVSHWTIVKKIVEGVRKKGGKYVEKYGTIGIALFIAIPLPGSGVWSGTLLAWLFGLNWKHGFIASLIGVLIAGSIVFAASVGIFSLI